MSDTPDLTNRDLIFCPAACKAEGRSSPLQLASVGFLARLRAVSYSCEACGHVTAASLRKGSFALPEPGRCWNCNVAFAALAGVCASCGACPDLDRGRADGVFFTYPEDALGDLAAADRAGLLVLLDRARAAGKLDQALAAADALTHRHPGDAASWRRKASLYLEHGLLALALHATKRALRIEPEDLDTILSFATVLELLDELEEATALLERTAILAPKDPRPRAALASLLEKLERFDEAAVAAREAVRLDPGRADAWATIATLHMRKKEYAEATRAWEHVLAAAPDFPLAWRYKGLSHLALEQWDLAREAGMRAGEDDAEAPELVFEALLAGGDGAGALAQAERCLTREPDATRLLYLKARACMLLGDFPQGLAVCDRIVALEPHADWAKRARASFASRLAPGAL